MPKHNAKTGLRACPSLTERIVGLLILLLLALIVGTFLLTSGLFADTVNRTPPLRALKNWIGVSEQPLFEVAARSTRFVEVPDADVVPPDEVERYTDNLYEKIDGKEGMFRAFFFVELLFGQYRHPQGQDTYDVYLFDMGAPVNAFGIYMAERSPTAEPISIGRDAYVSGANVYFCSDRYYVNVLGPAEGGTAELDTAKRIANAIADTIVGFHEPFWAEAYLPSEDRIPHSLSYQATSALGYEFLGQLFLADYETDGKAYQLYLIRTPNPETAADMLEKFAEAATKYGDKVIDRQPVDGGETVVIESFGVFGAAFCQGVFFGGSAECGDQALAVERAAALRRRLPGTNAPKPREQQ